MARRLPPAPIARRGPAAHARQLSRRWSHRPRSPRGRCRERTAAQDHLRDRRDRVSRKRRLRGAPRPPLGTCRRRTSGVASRHDRDPVRAVAKRCGEARRPTCRRPIASVRTEFRSVAGPFHAGGARSQGRASSRPGPSLRGAARSAHVPRRLPAVQLRPRPRRENLGRHRAAPARAGADTPTGVCSRRAGRSAVGLRACRGRPGSLGDQRGGGRRRWPAALPHAARGPQDPRRAGWSRRSAADADVSVLASRALPGGCSPRALPRSHSSAPDWCCSSPR